MIRTLLWLLGGAILGGKFVEADPQLLHLRDGQTHAALGSSHLLVIPVPTIAQYLHFGEEIHGYTLEQCILYGRRQLELDLCRNKDVFILPLGSELADIGLALRLGQ